MKYSPFNIAFFAFIYFLLSVSACKKEPDDFGTKYKAINNQTGFAQITFEGETLTFDLNQEASYNAYVGGRPTGISYTPQITSLKKEEEVFSIGLVVSDEGNPVKELNQTVSGGNKTYYEESLQGMLNKGSIILELVKDGNTYTSISSTSDLQQASTFEITTQRIATKDEYTGLAGAHYIEANFNCKLLLAYAGNQVTTIHDVEGSLKMFLVIP